MPNTRANRAQQFIPFAALKGYYDLILQKGRVTEARRTLSDDAAEELSRTLARLACGQVVAVTHYDVDCYVRTTGVVARIDTAARILTVVKTHIPFDDIVAVEDA